MLDPLAVYGMLGCRIVVGAAFGLAAVGKMRDMGAFAESITGLVPLGDRAARTLATAMVAAETLVVVSMALGGRGLPWGFVLAAVLLLGFSAVLLRSLLQGSRVSCNCFGQSTQPISVHDIARNAGLLTVAATGLFVLYRSDVAGQPIAVADGLLAGLMAIGVVALLLHVREVVMLVRPARAISAMEGPS